MELASFIGYQENYLDSITKILNEDQFLIWKHKNDYRGNFQNKDLITNNLGFRGTNEHLESWLRSEKRVLVLGASPSFGWGVNEQDTYSALLEKKFQDVNMNFAVLNASQIGYSSNQGRKLFSKYINTLNPTHIVISYILNDLDYYRFYDNRIFPDSKRTEENKYIISLRNIFSKSYSYKLLKRVLDSIAVNKTDQPIDLSKNTKNPRVWRHEFIENYKAIINLAIDHHITPIILIMPVNLDPNKNSGERHKDADLVWQNSILYQQGLRNLCLKNKLNCLDIDYKFSQYDDYLFVDPKKDPIHPNENGHRIIANQLIDFFKTIN